jgi:hypothetical protein
MADIVALQNACAFMERATVTLNRRKSLHKITGYAAPRRQHGQSDRGLAG